MVFEREMKMKPADEIKSGATFQLLSISEVADLCRVSESTIRRLTDRAAMPRPVKIGALLRWQQATGDPQTGIQDWIAAGCPRAVSTQSRRR